MTGSVRNLRWPSLLAATIAIFAASAPAAAQLASVSGTVPATSVWQTRAGASPSPRTLQCLAYDSRRGRTVLFGGNTATGVTTNETWESDGTSWRQLQPAASPPARIRTA